MRLRQEVQPQGTPRDVFVAKLQLLRSRSEDHRGQLTQTRAAIARRTDSPDLLQLAETMKALGVDLGQERADATWLKALHSRFRHDYATIVEVWRLMQQIRQELDRDPSEKNA